MQEQWKNSSGYEGRTAPIRTLSLDLETYSSENLTKCGVYRYAESPDFEILLFGYSADGAPVKVVDLTAGETLPADVLSALTDPAVTKWASLHRRRFNPSIVQKAPENRALQASSAHSGHFIYPPLLWGIRCICDHGQLP